MGKTHRILVAMAAGLHGLAGAALAGGQPATDIKGIMDDTPGKIRFILPPVPSQYYRGPTLLLPIDDSADRAKEAMAAAAALPLKPPVAPEFPLPSLPLPSDLVVPSLSLAYPFCLIPPEPVSVLQKTVRDFPDYWAKLEAREGVDELRRQLGMMPASGARTGLGPVPGLQASNGGLGVNFISLGSAFWQAWEKANLEKNRQLEFQAKVNGLMGYAQDLGSRKDSGPAISIILARLDFMKKKAVGKLPPRPERLAFTEPLRAWAVNPVFDSTQLGAPLLDICRIYEEMTD